MNRKWQKFSRRATPTPSKPFLTIQRGGKLISWNEAAHNLLNNPEAVELVYDPEDQVIGICPADANDPDSYLVRLMAKSQTTHTVAGRAFTSHWGIDTRVALRYPVHLEDGYLVVDLKKEGSDVTGPRSMNKNAAGLRARYKKPVAS